MNRVNPDDLPIMRLTRYLVREVELLLRRCGRYLDADLVDQAQRAVHSVALNTAEAVSMRSPGKKAYQFELARGSAGELGRALDMISDRIPEPSETDLPRRRTRQIMGQLARLIASFRSRT